MVYARGLYPKNPKSWENPEARVWMQQDRPGMSIGDVDTGHLT